MEPIPETVEAIEEYGPFRGGDHDLVADLRDRGREVQLIVPDCLGFSLATFEHGVTFTVMANELDAAVLDAVQYLAGGPCVAAVEEQHIHPTGFDLDELLDEGAWQLFGRATAAKGVRSTLTLPIVLVDVVVGSVNLYGGSGAAFSGHHEALAALFDAWAPGAVTNADLSFATLREARRAPEILKKTTNVAVAIGIIAARDDTDVVSAEQILREAAERAGVALHHLARAVIEAHGSEDQ